MTRVFHDFRPGDLVQATTQTRKYLVLILSKSHISNTYTAFYIESAMPSFLHQVMSFSVIGNMKTEILGRSVAP